jgi:hypothetical protein
MSKIVNKKLDEPLNSATPKDSAADYDREDTDALERIHGDFQVYT